MTRSFGAIVLLAALLRAPGLFTELWLDEIHGLSNATSVSSASQILTGIHHDSNHWLMSLWMYALGDAAPFWAYRIPSFVAGVAAVLFAGWLAELEGSRPGLAMLLTATSFPLVFYSSEARGYSLAALASLGLVLCLVRWVETRRLRFLVGSSIAACLGLLSHLSFVLVLAAALGYCLVLVGRGSIALPPALAPHAAPVLLLGTLLVLNLGYFVIGGGTSEPPATVLLQTASLAFGGPMEGRAVPFIAAFVALLLAAEVFRRVRDYWPDRTSTSARSHLWIFFGAAVLIPVWVAVALVPPFLFPRYFLVLLVFVPLLIASLAARLERRWSVLLIAAFVVSNCHAVWRFTREGRGRYEEALSFVLESSDREAIAIGSDHDLRNERVVGFYLRRLGRDGERLRYVGAEEAAAAEFWIGSYEGSECEGCRFLREYPSSSLSGSRWKLYRKGN